MGQNELTEFFAELTEFAAELSEFSLPKQYSQSNVPPVSHSEKAAQKQPPKDTCHQYPAGLWQHLNLAAQSSHRESAAAASGLTPIPLQKCRVSRFAGRKTNVGVVLLHLLCEDFRSFLVNFCRFFPPSFGKFRQFPPDLVHLNQL